MKRFKYLIAVCVLLFANVCGMEDTRHPVNAQIKAYFVPYDQEAINRELFLLLERAKKQVLIAMYWITDDFIIDKLIKTKKRGIDVQIIFDESSKNNINVMNRFLENNIFPVISPSDVQGLMHNKFLVFDNKIVWTGSVNFTKTGFNPKSTYVNHENVVIIYSEDIAQKFSNVFFGIEKEIFNLYVDFFTNNRPSDLPFLSSDLPCWLNRLGHILYDNNYHYFANFVRARFRRFSKAQQKRLQEFFPGLAPREW